MLENENYLYALAQSFILGAFLSFFYIVWSSIALLFCFYKADKGDCITGKAIKHIMSFLYDLLFFIVITPICAIFLFCINLGVVRWYLILATLVGGYVYRITLGKIEKKILERIFEAIRSYVSKKWSFIFKKVYVKLKPKRKDKIEQKERVVLFEYNGKTGLS